MPLTDWLTTIWDQCAGLGALGPSASVVEVIVGDWLKDIFGLPVDASFAITTGCQMAHVTALAADVTRFSPRAAGTFASGGSRDHPRSPSSWASSAT